LTPRRHRLPRRQVLLKGGEPMTTASRITRRTVLSAAVAAPLTLAACGNRTVLANERGTTTVRFMLKRHAYRERAPCYYGVDPGVFADHGIGPKSEPGQGAARTTQAVAAGDVDCGRADTPVVLGNRGNGVDVKSIGVFLQTTPAAVQF